MEEKSVFILLKFVDKISREKQSIVKPFTQVVLGKPKRISPSTGIKLLLLLRAVVVTWGFEGVRTGRKVRPSKVLQTRGCRGMFDPPPAKKKMQI